MSKSSAERVEIRPWSEEGFEAAFNNWHEQDAHLAVVLLVLGWTGLW